MKINDLTKMLTESDYHIDALGRIVIDNPELLAAINGALSADRAEDLLLNGGCSNSGCT